MSSVYVLEPPTKGKVVLNTNLGPLDLELWPKEAPKAVRNFVQLCLEGYYDNTVFHRIIKTFMVQGGDPTGTGTGGGSIYGEPFTDEFHSRLRFNHRGLVACANAGSANSNHSQFFMTLDRCDWLDKKNTIFGKVTGETIFNLLKIGEVEIDKDDRPVYPPKILSVEVLWNPFDDIVPRNLRKSPEVQEAAEAVNKETKGRKAKKELNLLSFGEEVEEEEQQLAAVKEKKIKSSHDVLQDPRLLKAASDVLEVDPAEARRRKGVQESVRQALGGSVKGVAGAELRQMEAPSNDSDEGEVDFDKRMREQIMKKRMNLGDTKAGGADRKQGRSSRTKKPNAPSPASSSRPSAPPRNADKTEDDDDDDDDDGATKKEKLVIKKKGLGSEARAELAATADLDMQLLSPLEQQRAKYKQRKRTLQGREENTLAKLEKFKNKLLESKEKAVKSAEPEKPEDDEGWLAHNLKFTADGKRDDMARNEDPNQYVVQDPLLEKGKEKFNKMQARLKKREREWAGNSVT